MKSIRKNGVVAVGLIFWIVLGIGLFSNVSNDASSSALPAISLQATASANPATPSILENDKTSTDYDNGTYTYYYYRSDTALLGYHVIWAARADNTNYVNIALYNDSGYSNSLVTSAGGPNYLDWIVYRPSAVHTLYAKINVWGSDGNYYVQWERAEYSLVGNDRYGMIDEDNRIEVYTLYLDSTQKYDFSLLSGDAGTLIYIYYLAAGSATTYGGYVAHGSSISAFSPTTTDNYAILVISNYDFYWSFHSEVRRQSIPAFDILFAVLGLCLGLFLWRYSRKTTFI